jgi:signal transduction histidine kinase
MRRTEKAGHRSGTEIIGQNTHPAQGRTAKVDRIQPDIAALSRALQQRNADLLNLKEEKARWIAMAAHDLRHPVGAILTYADMLLEAPPEALREDDRSLVAAIRSCSESMLQLIGDISDLATLDSAPLSLETIDFEMAVHVSVDAVRPLAERKNIRIAAEVIGRPPKIRADMPTILQAFTNLIRNAVRCSPPGSDVEIAMAANGPDIMLSVKDHGPGIQPDEVNVIFQPFHKTRARASSGEPGTGLELAICRRIVERHGGRVWVESAAGAGSTFFVVLPASEKAAAASTSA